MYSAADVALSRRSVKGFEGVDRDDLETWMKIDEEKMRKIQDTKSKDSSAIVSETLGIASTDDDSDRNL
ncbi:hypothetical protein QE152_g29951 [Popillia japonica]|uniref:Uncharacterized protein n=1 Tax=Popillia japonica TaxID=7064 RepID=A0AAW1JH71_POPJA